MSPQQSKPVSKIYVATSLVMLVIAGVLLFTKPDQSIDESMDEGTMVNNEVDEKDVKVEEIEQEDSEKIFVESVVTEFKPAATTRTGIQEFYLSTNGEVPPPETMARVAQYYFSTYQETAKTRLWIYKDEEYWDEQMLYTETSGELFDLTPDGQVYSGIYYNETHFNSEYALYLDWSVYLDHDPEQRRWLALDLPGKSKIDDGLPSIPVWKREI